MKIKMRKKIGNGIILLVMVLMVLSIPMGVYAKEYLQGKYLNQGSTLTTEDIYISQDGHIAPYLSIKEVYQEGIITYIFLHREGKDYYLPKVIEDKKVARTATGVTLPSGKSIDSGTYQIRLCVNASNASRASMLINFLRCSY